MGVSIDIQSEDPDECHIFSVDIKGDRSGFPLDEISLIQ
jgi:hypothetical protein